MARLVFLKKRGNAGALADWVGKVGFSGAVKHVAKHVTGGDMERAKKVTGKLKGMAKKRGTLSPEHAYGKTAKGGPVADGIGGLPRASELASRKVKQGFFKDGPEGAEGTPKGAMPTSPRDIPGRKKKLHGGGMGTPIVPGEHYEPDEDQLGGPDDGDRDKFREAAGVATPPKVPGVPTPPKVPGADAGAGYRAWQATKPTAGIAQQHYGRNPKWFKSLVERQRMFVKMCGPTMKKAERSCVGCSKPLSRDDVGQSLCPKCRKPRPLDAARQTDMGFKKPPVKGQLDMFRKAARKGPGSRGGKVIGYTKSGKPVYEGREADHPAHKNWTGQDHMDAAEKHETHAAEHGAEFEEAMKEAVHKEGRGGWGKYEAVTHPREKRRFYSEKVQRSIHEPHRRGEHAKDIANKHRELATKEATRSVRVRSIRHGYEDEQKIRGISREQAEAEQSKYAKEYARSVGETQGKRAWGPPPATGRASPGRGGGEGGYFPPMKKAGVPKEFRPMKCSTCNQTYTSFACPKCNTTSTERERVAKQQPVQKARMLLLKGGGKCEGCGRSMTGAQTSTFGSICGQCRDARIAYGTKYPKIKKSGSLAERQREFVKAGRKGPGSRGGIVVGRYPGGQAKYERGRIRREGMGGFLNPPGHPEHTMSVETDLRRRPWNRGSMSLQAAADAEWLDPATRAEAKRHLTEFQQKKLPLDHPEVVDWRHQVLGYFKNCWKGTGEDPWNVQNLRMGAKPPDATLNDHAGVHFIQKHYPEYQPSPEDFGGAYWGTKPGSSPEPKPESKPEYQPKTGEACSCKPGVERDNCPHCEGTGMKIDFAAIRARRTEKSIFARQRAFLKADDSDKTPCPNCGQWQRPHKGEYDCMNQCAKRGFAPRKKAHSTDESMMRDLHAAVAEGQRQRARGEGSRGGVVTGHTPRGKAKYGPSTRVKGMTLGRAREHLREHGMHIRRTDGGDFRVAHPGGEKSEASAYYTNDLDDAVETGKDMARRKAESDKLKKARVQAINGVVMIG